MSEPVPTSTPRPRRLGRTLFQWAFFSLLAIFVGSLLVHWFPIEGAIAGIGALPVLIAQSCGIVLVGMALFWLVFLSERPRRTRAVLVALILLPLIGFAASIRDFDFTGDMIAMPVFRWQKPQTQVLEEYRSQVAAKPVAAVAVPAIAPEDMPGYRGLHRDGVLTGPPLRDDWAETPPRELWKHPVGEGYSAFVVVGNLLVTMEQRAQGEAVVCYDAPSGNEVWVQQSTALFDEPQGGPGPRSTPEIDGDRVYALGATGELNCLSLVDGQTLWNKNVLTMTGIQNAQWGMTSSPLVVDDQLVVNIGGPDGNGLLSFAKMTGDLLWRTAGTERAMAGDGSSAAKADDTGAGEDVAVAGSALAGYCSPMVAEIVGVRQILNFDGTGLLGHDLADGHVLWKYPFRNQPGINVAQPVVLADGSLIVSASYGMGTIRLKVTQTDGKWSVDPMWPQPSFDLKAKMASMVLHDGLLYGLDEGILVCLDPETGKRKWKGGRYGHGQLLLTNDRIVVLTEKGEIVLVKPSPQKLEEVARFQALPADVKTWNHPAMARGKLYVRNHHWMAAYDIAAPR